MDELLDTFDDTMQWTGTATRAEVHRQGLWHQTFHCWVLHRDVSGDALLLQRRHPTKDTHPNKLDVSCAGHLSAGENASDGVRELREELGIDVDFDKLHKAGVYTYSSAVGGVKDNEFCHVFVLIQEKPSFADYKPCVDEVSGLYLIRVSDLRTLYQSAVNQVTIQGFEMAHVGDRHDHTITVGLNDMAKYDALYYELLFATLDKLMGASA
ncbi:NUDIX domain-containing protein [Alicyclobacillus curvatus]|nr:NUDIX domain-containing protein [Alicyclobacillus curvatus]